MPVLTELTTAQCERLLRRGTFGRVGVVTSRGPEIVPVNYAVRGDAVVAHISPGSTLARHGDGTQLVFEVDLVDEERWHGWSVVARGTGSIVSDAPVDPRGPASPRPWADGDRSCELRIAWTELSGRKVGAGWDAEAAMYSTRMAR
jgi:hypothetical protein